MKILLVDDSKSARYALRLQLQRHGVQVEMADSAEAAFELLKDSLPDAILMDHMMPGLNGFEALEVLRESPRTAGIPVVMCTSHEDADFVATAQRKGVAGILPKSLAAEKLPQILASLETLLSSAAAEPVPVPPTAPPTESPTEIPAAAAPAPSGLDAAAVRELIDATLDASLQAQLGRLLTPLLDEVRRDLSEHLLAETRRLIESRLAEAEQQRGFEAKPPTHDEVRAIAEQAVKQAASELVRFEMEGERGRLFELVERTVREQLQRAPHTAAEALEQRLAALDESLSERALAAARRESHEAVERALSRDAAAGAVSETLLGAKLKGVYLAIAATLVLSLGAVAAVYFLRG